MVKLCGKVAMSSCFRFLPLFFFSLANSSCFFALHEPITLRWNCVLCALCCVYGKFLAFVTIIKCSKGILNSSGLAVYFCHVECVVFSNFFVRVVDAQRFGAMNTNGYVHMHWIQYIIWITFGLIFNYIVFIYRDMKMMWTLSIDYHETSSKQKMLQQDSPVMTMMTTTTTTMAMASLLWFVFSV